MKTYAIHESNLERLRKKVNRIRNKCVKYGCDFHYAEVGEEFRTFNEGEKDEHVEKFIIVECEGTAVVNGWEFAATIDHTPEGNILHSLKDVPEDIPSKYYTCGPECEHCKSKRHRKDTYLVYNRETHEFKQVGSSCLCDFTNGFSSEAAAQYIALFEAMIQGEAPSEGWDRTVWYSVEEILRYAYCRVKYLGYTSTCASYYEGEVSTKEQVIDEWRYDHGRADKYQTAKVEEYRGKYQPDVHSEETTQYVKDMLTYISGLNDDSDYIHNLKILAKSEWVEYRNLGYLVSMVPCYNKYLKDEEYKQKRAEREAKEASTSTHVANVNDRITVNDIKMEAITSWETMFGLTTRYKITDAEGNIYMWDSSSYVDLDRAPQSIIGTVKKHDEFNGVKQTWLTRCRVSYKEV